MSLHCCRGRVQMFRDRRHFATTNPEVFFLQLIIWQIRKLKFSCWPQTSPTLFLGVLCFLFGPEIRRLRCFWCYFNDKFFWVKKKRSRRRVHRTLQDCRHWRWRASRCQRVQKGKWFNVMLRCNVCLWRLNRKCGRLRPGAANCVHIMICYGAENSENPK